MRDDTKRFLALKAARNEIREFLKQCARPERVAERAAVHQRATRQLNKGLKLSTRANPSTHTVYGGAKGEIDKRYVKRSYY